MIKKEELMDPTSCINQANDNDEVFVFTEGDPAAGFAIREWCKRRIILGKNKLSDYKILDALKCAEKMEKNER